MQYQIRQYESNVNKNVFYHECNPTMPGHTCFEKIWFKNDFMGITRWVCNKCHKITFYQFKAGLLYIWYDAETFERLYEFINKYNYNPPKMVSICQPEGWFDYLPYQMAGLKNSSQTQ
jgi:hypothetical protein